MTKTKMDAASDARRGHCSAPMLELELTVYGSQPIAILFMSGELYNPQVDIVPMFTRECLKRPVPVVANSIRQGAIMKETFHFAHMKEEGRISRSQHVAASWPLRREDGLPVCLPSVCESRASNSSYPSKRRLHVARYVHWACAWALISWKRETIYLRSHYDTRVQACCNGDVY